VALNIKTSDMSVQVPVMLDKRKIDWAKCPTFQFNPQIHHGRPVLAGTRMPVDDLVSNYDAGV
jgi:hypothetical protein